MSVGLLRNFDEMIARYENNFWSFHDTAIVMIIEVKWEMCGWERLEKLIWVRIGLQRYVEQCKRTMTLEDEAGKKLKNKDKFQKVGRKICGF